MTRNSKRFLFIQVNVSEDTKEHTPLRTSLLLTFCATDNYRNFIWIESRPVHWNGVTRLKMNSSWLKDAYHVSTSLETYVFV